MRAVKHGLAERACRPRARAHAHGLLDDARVVRGTLASRCWLGPSGSTRRNGTARESEPQDTTREQCKREQRRTRQGSIVATLVWSRRTSGVKLVARSAEL